MHLECLPHSRMKFKRRGDGQVFGTVSLDRVVYGVMGVWVGFDPMVELHGIRHTLQAGKNSPQLT